MQISGGYSSGNIFDLSEITRDENRRKYSSIESQTTASGDSVDISDEARKLYSEMIHKYDKPASSGGEGQGESQSGGSGAAGGAGGSEGSTDEIENIKKQIQALKSQLMALASQAGSGAGSAAMGKMNALQSQIAALEAQLNAMQQAG